MKLATKFLCVYLSCLVLLVGLMIALYSIPSESIVLNVEASANTLHHTFHHFLFTYRIISPSLFAIFIYMMKIFAPKAFRHPSGADSEAQSVTL